MKGKEKISHQVRARVATEMQGACLSWSVQGRDKLAGKLKWEVTE